MTKWKEFSNATPFTIMQDKVQFVVCDKICLCLDKVSSFASYGRNTQVEMENGNRVELRITYEKFKEEVTS